MNEIKKRKIFIEFHTEIDSAIRSSYHLNEVASLICTVGGVGGGGLCLPMFLIRL
jgi:hypothetical protein